MSYSRFLTPRIYTDVTMSLLSRGLDTAEIAASGVSVDADSNLLDLFNGRPGQTVTFSTSGGSTSLVITLDTTLASRYIAFDSIAVLNTNFFTAGGSAGLVKVEYSNDGSAWTAIIETGVVNCTTEIGGASLTANGSAIFTIPETSKRYLRVTFDPDGSWDATDLYIGCLFFGQSYDFAHGPDLAIKQALEHKGVKRKTSASGAIYSSANYLGGAAGQPFRWEGYESELLLRNGRRIVDCEFSHIDDTDLQEDDGTSLLQELTSIESLLQRVSGGHLPCIFTPDGTSTTSGDYIFGRLDGNKMSSTQIANKVWRHGFRFVEDF
jgi:hypothetical protein